MQPPDEALLSLLRQWIAKADLDYRTAERLLRDEEPLSITTLSLQGPLRWIS